MNRSIVLKTLMKQKKLKNYLEIGVFNGHIFFGIKSMFKIAVDPDFAFSKSRIAGKIMLNPFNICNHYFQKTSDDFFELDAPKVFANKKIEISLIDGMHEYEFVLRDIENTIKYAAENVFIILHDCNPQAKEDACSFNDWKNRKFTGVWNGDVWKAILHVKSQRNDLRAFVLDCDQGLGIIVKKQNNNLLPYTNEQITKLKYEDFATKREEFLDLKPASYFTEFMASSL